MKKQGRQMWQLVVLGLLGIAMVLSLMVPEEFLMKAEPERVEISILIRQTDSSVWSVARQGMEQAAEDLGAELRFLTLATDNNSLEQIDLLRRQADMNVDAAVVVPANSAALEECLASWKAFPVVTVESQVKGAAACVAPDDKAVGQLLARQVVKDRPQGGKILLLSSCFECSGVTLRLQSAQTVLEENGFTVQVCQIPTVQNLKQVDSVLCFDTQTMRQTIDLIEQMENVPCIYGAGAASTAVARLETGEVSALAAWSEYSQGYLAVTQAVCAARGQAVKDCALPVTVVQEGDTYDPDHQKLLYPMYY